MTPGGFIRARRVRHGMTQGQVAIAAGVEQTDLSKYERDAKSLGLAVAYRISRAIHDHQNVLASLISGEFIQLCRVCGCSENDCAGCSDGLGVGCYWFEPDLCSACAPIPVFSEAGTLA